MKRGINSSLLTNPSLKKKWYKDFKVISLKTGSMTEEEELDEFISKVENQDALIALMCKYYKMSIDNRLPKPDCVKYQNVVKTKKK